MANATDTLLHVPAQPQHKVILGHHHRRHLLGGIAAASAVAAISVPVEAVTVDPHLTWEANLSKALIEDLERLAKEADKPPPLKAVT